MAFDRRGFLAASLSATLASLPTKVARAQASSQADDRGQLGIPGPYPGRVVAVHHPNSIASGAYQPSPLSR